MRGLLCAVLLLGTGCSTIGTLTSGEPGWWTYSGTRKNLEPFQPPPPREDGVPMCGMNGLQRVVSVCDFPWSLALDTVVLPVTLLLDLFTGPPIEREEDQYFSPR
jgi:uncharacterized protein YceK